MKNIQSNKIVIFIGVVLTALLVLGACDQENETITQNEKAEALDKSKDQVNFHHSLGEGKPVIYQVFTRLFGNTNSTNKPWGSIEENGVGKFDDFNDQALLGIKELGTSYIWYTGVPHHAVINDYSEYDISLDDPDVVKGRAGSPYAVKDYYDVNPDLANNPANRIAEFEGLIERTHKHNMKVIIDIVPNHVARKYESKKLPAGQTNFGANDDVNVEYAKHNNFYYIQGKAFEVPDAENAYIPLGGETHPLADGKFYESPAKWTGNGSRAAKPNANDWYETVKVNYGVKPDGTYDFPTLPEAYRNKNSQAHFEFWQQQSNLPDSWYKFEAIAHYWLDKGVDGFRYDMAEMVPVEFWSFLNSSIKAKHPDALLLAEVYNPSLYRDYIRMGKMDYLYDKVEFYDSLKKVMQNQGPAGPLEDIQLSMNDIEAHMLHFLENHDEQRIASPGFAGKAEIGKPALAVSALISRSPTMLYFGQEVGEDGSEETGFGDPTRTTIFDYAGVPAHQRWMNDGKFDGGGLSNSEKSLRSFHIDVMNISAHHSAMMGEYQSIHSYNVALDNNYSERQFSFVRYSDKKALVVVANFDDKRVKLELSIPQEITNKWQIALGQYSLKDLISEVEHTMNVKPASGNISLSLEANESKVLELSIGMSNE